MKKPILGKQTFLTENRRGIMTFKKFLNEIYYGVGKDKEEKPLYTGRHFVILKDKTQSFKSTQKLFESKLGFRVANTREFLNESVNEDQLQDADALIYDDLGIALVGGEEDQIKILESAKTDFFIESEKVVYVPNDAPARINIPTTWGVRITNANNSSYTGRDIKVAVLDTGFDISHPDFIGRNIISKSFVPNQQIQDLHGHGTHCIGTACGNTDMHGLRYGVAKDSVIYAGKVLGNQGSGAQAWVLNGMNWAINNGCKVISMSFGSEVIPRQGYDLAYERAAQYALSKGSIVLAAAGNESRRHINRYEPVGSPADCPSIIAVAAIDRDLYVADFSNRSINPTGQIDIAGPGVFIYSTWIRPMRYRTISGTSMATPHVAGIVALLWEKYPSMTPHQIINELKNSAKRLQLLPVDVGVGLAMAP